MKWKVIATNPPTPRKPSASRLAWGLAIIMVAMAVIHLVRIDTLIPVVAKTLGENGAAWAVALVVIGEVLAVPYLLQMKLSPLFRLKSGLLVVLVPLTWTCFTIWALGNGHSTGQLSSYVATPAAWWSIGLNLVWLGVSYYALWLLRFNETFRAIQAAHTSRR